MATRLILRASSSILRLVKNLDQPHITQKKEEIRLKSLSATGVSEPEFFTLRELNSLKALCAIAIPQLHQDWEIDLAGVIDSRLALGEGKGWRYGVLPPDELMFREALSAIEKLAGKPLYELTPVEQRDLFPRISRIDTPNWMSFFWNEFLVEVTEEYFNHPLTSL